MRQTYSATIAFAIEGPDDFTLTELGEHLAELVCLDLDYEEAGDMHFSKAKVVAAAIDWSTSRKEPLKAHNVLIVAIRKITPNRHEAVAIDVQLVMERKMNVLRKPLTLKELRALKVSDDDNVVRVSGTVAITVDQMLNRDIESFNTFISLALIGRDILSNILYDLAGSDPKEDELFFYVEGDLDLNDL